MSIKQSAHQKSANLIIFKSPNGRDDWTPVMPVDVPEWVKHPDCMARLVAGEQACDSSEGDSGSDWYRAEPNGYNADIEALRASAAKRERRAERNLRVIH